MCRNPSRIFTLTWCRGRKGTDCAVSSGRGRSTPRTRRRLPMLRRSVRNWARPVLSLLDEGSDRVPTAQEARPAGPRRGPAGPHAADAGGGQAHRVGYAVAGPVAVRLWRCRLRHGLLLGRGADLLAAAGRVLDVG